MSETAIVMEEQHTHHEVTAPAAAPGSEFDRKEVAEFGAVDGEAVTIISKMLVIFFIYSFIIMCGVGWWTWSSGNTPLPTPHDAHAEDMEE